MPLNMGSANRREGIGRAPGRVEPGPPGASEQPWPREPQHHFMNHRVRQRLPHRVGRCRGEPQMIREAAGSPPPALPGGSRTRAQESAQLERLMGGPGTGERPQRGPWRRTGKVDGQGDHPQETVRRGRQGTSPETVAEVQRGHTELDAWSQLPPSKAKSVVAWDREDPLEAPKEALNADAVGVHMGPVHGGGACHPSLFDDFRGPKGIRAYVPGIERSGSSDGIV
jgi:hypothetical protein